MCASACTCACAECVYVCVCGVRIRMRVRVRVRVRVRYICAGYLSTFIPVLCIVCLIDWLIYSLIIIVCVNRSPGYHHPGALLPPKRVPHKVCVCMFVCVCVCLCVCVCSEPPNRISHKLVCLCCVCPVCTLCLPCVCPVCVLCLCLVCVCCTSDQFWRR